MLAKGDKSIAEETEHFDITRTAIKKHFRIPEEGQLIAVRTEGRTRMSQLNASALAATHDGKTSRQVRGHAERAEPPRVLVCTFMIPYFEGGETTPIWYRHVPSNK